VWPLPAYDARCLPIGLEVLMVKVHQSKIPPPWVGVALKMQQISEVGGFDPPT
jgi:hypothetical protein